MESNFTRIKVQSSKVSVAYGADNKRAKSKDSKPWKAAQKKQQKRNWNSGE